MQKETAPAASTYSQALRFLARFRHLLTHGLAAAGCGAVSSGLQLLVPLSSMVIINQAIPSGDAVLLLWIAAGLAAAMAFSLAFAYGEFLLSARLRERIALELQRDAFEHLQRLRTAFFKGHDSGYVMSRLTNDPMTAIEFPAGLATLGRSLVWFLAAFVLVPVVHPIIGLVVVMVIPIYAAILVGFNRRIKDQFSIVQERTAVASRELFESLAGISETKAYGAEGYRARRYVHSLVNKARSLVQGRKLMALGGHSTQVVVLMVTLFVLVFGGTEVMRGRLSLGELVALSALVGYLLTPVNDLVQKAFTMHRSLAAVERLNEILLLEPEPRRMGRRLEQPVRGHLRFVDVSFHYGANQPVLNRVDFEVEQGQIALFVGPSGEGKSSLMSLLPRFYEPTEGQILLDGDDLAELDLRDLRRQIAYVSQDTFLFSDTVIANLRVGRPSATREEVREAARRANALDFIEALPQGFDTRVGERGSRLSGGQRQRIAVARALLKEAPILILDEATSAVDQATEESFFEALERLMQGRTVLVVAHHSEAFMHRVDRIFEVKNGCVVERAEGVIEDAADDQASMALEAAVAAPFRPVAVGGTTKMTG